MPTSLYAGAFALPLASTVLQTFSLNGTTDAIEMICQAEAADTITHIGFRYSSRTGTPPTFRMSIQGVGATGIPDGTIKGGASPASATFTPPADDTWNATWQWVALDNGYTTTRGEWIALVIDYSSGTVDGSNYSTFNTRVLAAPNTPYIIENDATSRTKRGGPIFGYKSATTSYGQPYENVQATTYSSTSTPDEYALSFVWGSTGEGTYSVKGAALYIQSASASKTLTVNLYDGTTLLQQATWDSDYTSSTGTTNSTVILWFQDTTLDTLVAGSRYLLSITSSDTTVNIGMNCIVVDSAAELKPFAGGAWYLSTRTDSGAWSDDTTKLPGIVPIIDTNAPAASGGLLTGNLRAHTQ